MNASRAGAPASLRRTLGRFSTGVAIVTTAAGDRAHGMTLNAFMSLSLEPPLVAIAISDGARMADLLPAVGRFGLSILGAGQRALAEHFAGGDAARHIGFEWHDAVPLLRDALGHLVCEVSDVLRHGDHLLVIGRVVHHHSRAGAPLVFFAGRLEVTAWLGS